MDQILQLAFYICGFPYPPSPVIDLDLGVVSDCWSLVFSHNTCECLTLIKKKVDHFTRLIKELLSIVIRFLRWSLIRLVKWNLSYWQVQSDMYITWYQGHTVNNMTHVRGSVKKLLWRHKTPYMEYNLSHRVYQWKSFPYRHIILRWNLFIMTDMTQSHILHSFIHTYSPCIFRYFLLANLIKIK